MSGTVSILPIGNVGYAILDNGGNVLVFSWMPFQQWHSARPVNSVAVDPTKFDQLFESSNSGTRYIYIGGAFEVVPDTPALSSLQSSAISQINTQAEACREQFLTNGICQMLVYEAKAMQAKTFLAEYPTEADAAVASPNDWQLLQAEVGITASTMWGVARVVTGLGNIWQTIAAVIEQIRLTAKAAVVASSSSEEVAAALSGAVFPISGQPGLSLISKGAVLSGLPLATSVHAILADGAAIAGGIVSVPYRGTFVSGAAINAAARTSPSASVIACAPPIAKGTPVFGSALAFVGNKLFPGAHSSFVAATGLNTGVPQPSASVSVASGSKIAGGTARATGALLTYAGQSVLGSVPNCAVTVQVMGASAISGGQPTAA